MISSTHQRLLALLAAGYRTQTELALRLGLKKSTLAKRLERMVAKGEIRGIGKTINRYYEPMSKDVESGVESRKSVPSKTSLRISHASAQAQATLPHATQQEQQRTMRLHALGLKHTLQHSISTEQIAQKLKDAGIAYDRAEGTDFYFFTLCELPIRLTPKSLTAWARRAEAPRGTNVAQLDAKARLDAEAAIWGASSLLAAPINETYEVVQEHIAFVGDEGAELSVASHHKIAVLDPDDQHTRFSVDISTGVPEAEFVHRKHALGDSKLYEEMVVDVVKNDGWQESKRQLLANSQQIGQVVGLVESYGKEIQVHVAYMYRQLRKLGVHPARRPKLQPEGQQRL